MPRYRTADKKQVWDSMVTKFYFSKKLKKTTNDMNKKVLQLIDTLNTARDIADEIMYCDNDTDAQIRDRVAIAYDKICQALDQIL